MRDLAMVRIAVEREGKEQIVMSSPFSVRAPQEWVEGLIAGALMMVNWESYQARVLRNDGAIACYCSDRDYRIARCDLCDECPAPQRAALGSVGVSDA